MILLDTHIWVWWVNGDTSLTDAATDLITTNEASGLGVSIISCWEVAKKVQLGKLALDRDIDSWLGGALAYPGIHVLDLTPAIVVESARLPLPFHRDPADQLIVATARVLGISLLTEDAKLVASPHVVKAGQG